MKKRHALVTGASSGIGLAIVTTLLNDGWRVTGLSRTAPEIHHPDFTTIRVDLMNTAQLLHSLEDITTIDALIHAAGKMTSAPLGQLNLPESQTLWHLHIHVAELLANTLVPKMGSGGRIILIGSRTSRGVAGRSQYVATKSAMVGMVRSWAAELATKGITANIIAPGATETPMLADPQRQQSPPKLPPIGRYIQPQEVAEYVRYIASPHAGAITGQELVICGGASLS
ncbi:SDR family NAD(P)-dependent oxidoreductase [Vibrio mangrovi]|uniref:3-oxoacyl-[acyl-carrier-protein] reductase FabG n=1 Tax=Vibrio mangrovi TaxID=474394 RepID=A0A1Y6ITU4_9VIBR|nr:SDR family oxidoreductase [Vibrio mangrovi]MDW6004767.1 SDR family oxidoreductase [Vibrio mangrovi]SMS01058.1 3-oxoacyl-[acyl-carrier-protein] reductase FabG [Vibrio mangrovi]